MGFREYKQTLQNNYAYSRPQAKICFDSNIFLDFMLFVEDSNWLVLQGMLVRAVRIWH